MLHCRKQEVPSLLILWRWISRFEFSKTWRGRVVYQGLWWSFVDSTRNHFKTRLYILLIFWLKVDQNFNSGISQMRPGRTLIYQGFPFKIVSGHLKPKAKTNNINGFNSVCKYNFLTCWLIDRSLFTYTHNTIRKGKLSITRLCLVSIREFRFTSSGCNKVHLQTKEGSFILWIIKWIKQIASLMNSFIISYKGYTTC